MGRHYLALVGCLVLLLQLGSHAQGEYCANTLARKTCPSLTTFDSIDLSAYSGRWYEIGSSASFKNSFEAGGTCAQAVYSQGEKGGELKVENSQLLSAKVGTIASVLGISGSCSLVCQSARALCSQVKADDSFLREGISKVWKFKGTIEGSYSTEASSVSTANAKIESAADGIAPNIEALVKYVSEVQTSNSLLSQADGGSDKSSVVASIKSSISSATEQVNSVDASFKAMSDAQLDLVKVAGSLFRKGGSAIGPSFVLTDAATEVLGGITAIKTQVAAITAALEVSSQAAGAVVEDKSKAYYNVTKVIGKAVQNSSDGGKLSVTFDPVSDKLKIPGGKYWVLAVNGEAGKYNAALVYSCTELVTGGIDETVWVLSRTPELDAATTSSFLSSVSSLGINQDCDSPFVSTVRSSNCPA